MNYHLWGDWDSLTEWVRKVELAKKEGLLSEEVIDEYVIIVPTLVETKLVISADLGRYDKNYNIFIPYIDVCVSDVDTVDEVKEYAKEIDKTIKANCWRDEFSLVIKEVCQSELFDKVSQMIEAAILMRYHYNW